MLLQSTKPNRCTGAIITIKTTCKYLFGLKKCWVNEAEKGGFNYGTYKPEIELMYCLDKLWV